MNPAVAERRPQVPWKLLSPTWAGGRIRGSMDKLNVEYFYDLGFNLGRMQSVSVSNEKLNSWHWSAVLGPAREWAQSCAAIEGILPKTKKAAGALDGALEKFSTLLGEDRKPTESEWSAIPDAIAEFYKVFEQ